MRRYTYSGARQAVIVLILTSLSTVFVFSPAYAREVVVKTVDWPPYYTSKSMTGGPLAVITERALANVGHSMSLQFIPWKKALAEVKNGEADMLLGAYESEQRRQDYHFSERIFTVKEYIIGLESRGVTSYKELRELKRYLIGVTSGYVYSESFTQAYFLKKDPAFTDLVNVKKLFAGRVDFVVMNANVFAAYLSNLSDHERLQRHVLVEPPLGVNGIFNLFSRKVADGANLREQFNLGLKRLVESGQYDTILELYGVR